MKQETVVNVLWTGGWDSTFRVLMLAQKPIILKTHYIVYPHRRSRQYELNAMNTIFEHIKNDKRTKCQLEPINIVKFEDIPKNETITESFEKIRKVALIGNQYEYLARFAKTIGSIEIGIEKGGLAEELLYKLGKMNELPLDDTGSAYYVLDDKSSDLDLLNVFGNFKYPIFDMTKLEMKEIAAKEGFLDVMYKTWFCHFPRNGKPCGTCFPCHFTIEDGLVERFDKRTLARHKFDQAHKEEQWYKKYKRIRRRYLQY